MLLNLIILLVIDFNNIIIKEDIWKVLKNNEFVKVTNKNKISNTYLIFN